MVQVDSMAVHMNCEIVAQQKLGHWLAWFEQCPETKRAGGSAWSAITALIASFGWDVGHVEIVEHSDEPTSADEQAEQDADRPTLVLAVNSSSSNGFMDHICDLMDDSFHGVNGSINATSVTFDEPNRGQGKRPSRRADRAKRTRTERRA